MFAFRKNIRFLAIDMDRMTLKDPATIRSLSQKVAEGLIAGHFERLPYMCFSMDKIQDAVELMKSGQHIGKVLLSNLVEDGPGKGPLTIESNAVVRCDGDTYHLVLGGAGGIGAYLIITRSHARTLIRSHAHTLTRSPGTKMVRWLFRKGARKFIVSVSRDPTRVPRMFEDLIAAGATFEVVEADMSGGREGYDAIEKTVFGPVVGGRVESCVHCVGFWETFSFEDIQDDCLKLQAGVKVGAALFLDQLARKLPSSVLRHFILVGSSSSEQTVWNLASYGASNAMLAAIGRRRLSEGLPATICHLVTIVDVGVVATSGEALSAQRKSGWAMMNAASAVAKFESMLAEDVREVLCATYLAPDGNDDVKWKEPPVTPCVDQILLFGGNSREIDASLLTYDAILERVIWIFVDTMGVDLGDVTASASLTGIGIDSLGMMDVSKQLVDQFGYQIDRTAFSMTIGDLAMDVLQRLKPEAATVEDDVGEVGEVGAVGAVGAIGERDAYIERDASVSIAQSHEPTSLVGCNRRVAHPKGYVLICPGLENPERRGLTRLAFADWEQLEDVQVLHVNVQAQEWLRGSVCIELGRRALPRGA